MTSTTHNVPAETIAATRRRLAVFACTRGSVDDHGNTTENASERRERTRADAFAEARALARAHGGNHPAIMAAITPTDDDVARVAAERIGKAAKGKGKSEDQGKGKAVEVKPYPE